MSDRENKVTRCVCHDRTFTELRQYAYIHKLRSPEDFRALRLANCGCGRCGPYIRKMLKTGRTSFAPDEVTPEEEHE